MEAEAMQKERYNAFISYAWVDNEAPIEENRGWVSAFVYRLRKYLAQELGSREEGDRVWLDYERLRGSHNISHEIRQKLQSSRLFVPILSKGWQRSNWCQQELETFLETHGPDSGRVFPVWMSQTNDLPAPLDALLKYKFWYQDDVGKLRTRWYPLTDPTDREFGRLQQDMARDMAASLTHILKTEDVSIASEPRNVPVPQDAQTPRTLVLVNGGEEDAELIHEVARRLFKEHGIGATVPLSVLRDKSGLKSSDITRDLREKLKLCTSVLIVFKNGPAHQIHRQIIEFLKVSPQRRKDLPPPTLDLCRPGESDIELGFLPGEMTEHLCGPDCAADCILRFAGGRR